MSVTDNGTIKGIDVREDGVYITYVPADGADPVSKKLGNPEPDSSRFIYYMTQSGHSDTFYLPDGVYVYFVMKDIVDSSTIYGSIYEASFPTYDVNYRGGKYGIADTTKSNIILQNPGAGHHATTLLYKISD